MAYIPGYHTSLISHDVLREKSGAYLDGKHLLLRTADDAVFCTLTRLHRQLVVEYNEPSSSAYAIERSEAPPKKRTTARPKRSQVPLKASGTAEQWHLRLGHPGPEVIEHLPAEVEVLEPWTAPSTTECEGCALAKAHNVISRRPAPVPEKPFERISVD